MQIRKTTDVPFRISFWISMMVSLFCLVAGFVLLKGTTNTPSQISADDGLLVGERPHQISITIDPSVTLLDLISAGDYRFVNSKLKADNFPPDPNAGKATTLNVRIVSLGRYVSGEDALRELARLGLRPATPRELLALGAQYPALQKERSIIALGSPWKTPQGHSAVVVLRSVGGQRFADLLGASVLGWLDDVEFAAVAK